MSGSLVSLVSSLDDGALRVSNVCRELRCYFFPAAAECQSWDDPCAQNCLEDIFGDKSGRGLHTQNMKSQGQ